MADVYDDSSPKYSTVEKWSAESKRGRNSLEDDPRPGLEVIKLEHSLRLKIKLKEWMLADVSASSQSLRFILSLRMNSSFIT